MTQDECAIIFNGLSNEMRGFCLNAGVWREYVDDVVSQTWLRVVKGLETFDERQGSLGPWIIGCLRHEVKDHKRWLYQEYRRQDHYHMQSYRWYAVKSEERDSTYYFIAKHKIEDRLLNNVYQQKLAVYVKRLLDYCTPRQERLLRERFWNNKQWVEIAAEEGVTKAPVILAARKGLKRLERTINALAEPDKYDMPRNASRRFE